jgi:curved DNA-binding protein CbpA
MTGVRQNQLAGQLPQLLERLRVADPFKTLEVPVQVDGEGVRRAFLALTKKFHPNRFALEPASTRDLANEVFLLIRRAYDQLADDEKRKQWRDRIAPARPVTTVGTPPAPARPSGIVPTVPSVPAVSASARSPAATTGRVATVPGAGPPPAAGGTPRRPITAAGLGGASPQEVQAMLEAARTRTQRFEDALALLGRGKYREAREALYKIAMEDPQSKRYRVQLHHAWGLEHLADGKLAEAQRELERALGMEPESAEIKAALAKLKDETQALNQKKRQQSGILGKLFGR